MSLSIFMPLLGKAIDRLFPDKEKAAEAKFKMLQLEQDGEFKELEFAYNAIIAEAKSADPWTSRARPSFLYVMYLIILMGIPLALSAVFYPIHAQLFVTAFGEYLASIPDALWGLFGAGYLGYTVKRSSDKKNLINPNGSKSLLEKLF